MRKKKKRKPVDFDPVAVQEVWRAEVDDDGQDVLEIVDSLAQQRHNLGVFHLTARAAAHLRGKNERVTGGQQGREER
jgi:hypothetical protein